MIGKLAAALAKARAEFPPIRKNCTVKVRTRTGADYSFEYADYGAICEAVTKPLAKNGLAFTHLIQDGCVVTLLMHESGEYLPSSIPINKCANPQEYGSQVTYMKRYGLSGILGIATEDDDDGNLAAGNTANKAPNPKEEPAPVVASPEQIAQIKDAVGKLANTDEATDTDKICTFYKVDSITKLSEKDAKDCIRNLKNKAKKAEVEL